MFCGMQVLYMFSQGLPDGTVKSLPSKQESRFDREGNGKQFQCSCLETPFLQYTFIFVYVLSHFSLVQLFVTLWIVAHQAPLSMGFSRQKYWSGLPCPPPGGLPDPGIKAMFPALQRDSLLLSHPGRHICLLHPIKEKVISTKQVISWFVNLVNI